MPNYVSEFSHTSKENKCLYEFSVGKNFQNTYM